MKSGCIFRREEPGDYALTEFLTREAFWNVYQPGCEEHFILHSMRGQSAVVDELNYVCENACGAILGHIFYTRTQVMAGNGQFFPSSPLARSAFILNISVGASAPH